jgi:hypothetical protein
VRLALVVIALAACTEDGVYIEVVAPAGVDEVELYLGERECQREDTGSEDVREDCTRLQPDTFGRSVTAKIFIRDRDEPYVATVENGSAWFRLGVEDLASVPRLVAIGRTQSSPTSVAVVPNLELGSTRKVIIVLEDAPRWQNDETFQGPGVMEWADGRCVGVHGMADDHLFVVAAGDPDCDAVDKECDPLGYKADVEMGTPCVVDSDPAAPAFGCRVGSGTCSETGGGDDTCVPQSIVLEELVCRSCSGDGAFDPACITSSFGTVTRRINCTFPVRGPNFDYTACTNGPLPVDNQIMGTVDEFCVEKVGVAPLAFPFPEPFEDDIIVEDADRVKVELVDEPCTIAVDWSYAGTPPMTRPDDLEVLVYGKADLGPQGVVELVVPMRISHPEDPKCDIEPTCVYVEGPGG